MKLLPFLFLGIIFLNYSQNAFAQNNPVSVFLAPIANASFLEPYIDPPLGDVTLGNIPFTIAELPANIIITRGDTLSPWVETNIASTQAIYLLVNSFNTWHFYHGQKVAEIRFDFTDGTSFKVDLIIGQLKKLGEVAKKI